MNYDLLEKIRASVTLYTKKRTSNVLEGGFRSIFRGRSLDFDELREYVPGDNVKDIDISNSTIMYYTKDQQIDEKTAKLSLSNVKLVKQ